MKQNRKQFLFLTLAISAVFVLVMVLLFVVIPDASTSQVENRSLQTAPTLSLSRVISGDFTEDFEDYVEDQFPFRTTWIRVKTTLDRVMGQKESNGIYLASDGYLIQSFTEADEATYAVTLSALSSFAKNHSDLTQYMLVAPTAVTTLSDHLPYGTDDGAEAAYLAQLEADVAALGITVVDVQAALEAAAETEQIYYRTDHHWTTDGAYAAYCVLAAAADLSGAEVSYQRLLVSDSFSGTLTASSGFRMSETDPIYIYLPESDVPVYNVYYADEDYTSASFYWVENLEVRNQYTIFFNENHALVEIETNADTGRVLLVLKDSYANCFLPFLMPDYDKILVVDPRYYAEDLESLIALQGVTEVLYLYNATSLATDSYLAATIS